MHMLMHAAVFVLEAIGGGVLRRSYTDTASG